MDRGPVNPRHQFGDADDWMPGGDLGEGVGQIGFRVNPVQFRGLQDRVHRAGALAAGVTAGEEPVASSQSYAADCIFSDVIISQRDLIASCLGAVPIAGNGLASPVTEMENSPYLDQPPFPLAVALWFHVGGPAKIASAAPAEKRAPRSAASR